MGYFDPKFRRHRHLATIGEGRVRWGWAHGNITRRHPWGLTLRVGKWQRSKGDADDLWILGGAQGRALDSLVRTIKDMMGGNLQMWVDIPKVLMIMLLFCVVHARAHAQCFCTVDFVRASLFFFSSFTTRSSPSSLVFHFFFQYIKL